MIYDRLRSPPCSCSLPPSLPIFLSLSPSPCLSSPSPSLLPSLSLPVPLHLRCDSAERLSREHLHHLGASGMYRARLEEDSDLNGLWQTPVERQSKRQGKKEIGRTLYSSAVTREFITHYTAKELESKVVAMHFEFAVCKAPARAPPLLPVDFSSVINFQSARCVVLSATITVRCYAVVQSV